jgi:hypothetical protein
VSIFSFLSKQKRGKIKCEVSSITAESRLQGSQGTMTICPSNQFPSKQKVFIKELSISRKILPKFETSF